MIRHKPSTSLTIGAPTFPNLTANTKLPMLIGPNSWLLFQTFNSEALWLNKPPSVWKYDPDYEELSTFVHTVKTTNDLAERGVKLIQDYYDSISKDEEDRQFLLQSVEDHRKKIPNFKKKTLSNELSK